MSFIDASYFVAELGIPNSDEQAVAERITWFIQKHEPLFLQKLLGYPLYKAFVAGMSVMPPAVPDVRFINILYGCEFTDINGYVQKWKGLIVTDSPIYNLAGGLVYKRPVYARAGSTPGFIPNTNVAVLDGTTGKDDWRGWTPIVFRNGPLTPDVDYSWNPITGTFTLLRPGDVFGNNELFFTQFELRTDVVPAPDVSTNLSLIANYVYYQYRKANVTQFTGIGEVVTSAENSTNISPRRRVTNIWNELHDWVEEFCAFMEAAQRADPTAYPEWTLINEHDALKAFAFMNPHF